MRRTTASRSRWRAALAVSLFALVACTGRPPGRPSPEAAVRVYLHAIEVNDASAAYAVVARGYRDDLREQVRRFGGTPAARVRVRILDPVRPDADQVVVLTFPRPDGSSIEDESVVVVRRSGHWYVEFQHGPETQCEPLALCDTPAPS